MVGQWDNAVKDEWYCCFMEFKITHSSENWSSISHRNNQDEPPPLWWGENSPVLLSAVPLSVQYVVLDVFFS
jgi:hypothetical protein